MEPISESSPIKRFLRWSERYTKTDMEYAARGGFWLGINELRAVILSLLVTIALANYLDPRVYGTYQYFISAASIIGAFSLTGLSIALPQSVARGHDISLLHSYKQSWLWNTPSILLALSGAAYYSFKGNTAFGLCFLIIALATPAMNSGALFNSYLNGKKDFKTASLYGMYTSIGPAIALIAAAFFTDNLILIVFSSLAVKALLNIAMYYKTRRGVDTSTPVDPGLIPYAKHVSAINLFSIIVNKIDSIVIFQYLGPVQVAVYNFAIILPERLQAVFRNIMTLALPKFTGKARGVILRNIKHKTWIIALFLIPLIILTIILIPPVYRFLFPQYQGSIFYAQIYSVSLIAILAFLPLTSLHSHRRTGELYGLTFISSLIQLVLLLVYTYWYGVLGAVISRIAAKAIGTALNFYFAGLPPEEDGLV